MGLLDLLLLSLPHQVAVEHLAKLMTAFKGRDLEIPNSRFSETSLSYQGELEKRMVFFVVVCLFVCLLLWVSKLRHQSWMIDEGFCTKRVRGGRERR